MRHHSSIVLSLAALSVLAVPSSAAERPRKRGALRRRRADRQRRGDVIKSDMLKNGGLEEDVAFWAKLNGRNLQMSVPTGGGGVSLVGARARLQSGARCKLKSAHPVWSLILLTRKFDRHSIRDHLPSRHPHPRSARHFQLTSRREVPRSLHRHPFPNLLPSRPMKTRPSPQNPLFQRPVHRPSTAPLPISLDARPPTRTTPRTSARLRARSATTAIHANSAVSTTARDCTVRRRKHY